MFKSTREEGDLGLGLVLGLLFRREWRVNALTPLLLHKELDPVSANTVWKERGSRLPQTPSNMAFLPATTSTPQCKKRSRAPEVRAQWPFTQHARPRVDQWEKTARLSLIFVQPGGLR